MSTAKIIEISASSSTSFEDAIEQGIGKAVQSSVYVGFMADTVRLNVTLDATQAARLSAMAKRAHMQEGTLARSLLSRALDSL